MERQKSDGKWYCFDAHCRKRRREAGAREAGAGITVSSEALRGVQRAQSRRSGHPKSSLGADCWLSLFFDKFHTRRDFEAIGCGTGTCLCKAESRKFGNDFFAFNTLCSQSKSKSMLNLN